MNPYWGQTFFSFFPVFFSRMGQLLMGKLSWSELASDEVQVLVLACVAVASALVGALLVLKRMTMLANSLSHTILVGIVIAYLLLSSRSGGGEIAINTKVMLIAALATGLLTTLLGQFFHQVLKLQEDASIGLVFTSLFALGVVLVTLFTRNAHVGLEIVMGNADALHFKDLKLVSGVLLANAVIVTLFFKEWKLICFDQALATSFGFRPWIFNSLLMLMTSITAISAFRAVGVLLFLAFVVGLPTTARLITKRLSTCLLVGALFGLLAPLFGVALSRHMLTVYQMPLSTAGLTVTLIGSFFLLCLALRSLTRGCQLIFGLPQQI